MFFLPDKAGWFVVACVVGGVFRAIQDKTSYSDTTMAFTKVCEDEYSTQARQAMLANPVFRCIPSHSKFSVDFTYYVSF